MARPERYTVMIPICKQYEANMIALMWGPEGLPRDENERGALAAELIYAANEAGIPNEDIFVDPIITPVNIQQQQLMSTLTFMSMLQDIAPGAKSTCGLSNVSNGPPDHLRPILNQTYMIMLERNGMYSCIVDGFDDKITGHRPGQASGHRRDSSIRSWTGRPSIWAVCPKKCRTTPRRPRSSWATPCIPIPGWKFSNHPTIQERYKGRFFIEKAAFVCFQTVSCHSSC